MKALKIRSFQLIFTSNRLPFDWKTPFGYVIATIFITIATFAVLYALTLTLSFYASSCFLFNSFAKDITNNLSVLIVVEQSHRSHRHLKEYLCKIIQLNSNVKQLSKNLNQYS